MDFVAAIEATRRGKWKRRKLSLIFQISQINRITIERALVQPLSPDLVRESLEMHKFDDLFDSNWVRSTWGNDDAAGDDANYGPWWNDLRR